MTGSIEAAGAGEGGGDIVNHRFGGVHGAQLCEV